MKIYADSSYLLQFLTPDFATTTAIAMHRRLGRPSYLFVPDWNVVSQEARALFEHCIAKMTRAADRVTQ